MAWIILLAFVLILFSALIYFGKLPRHVYELTAAALLFGIAGYAWQGHPGSAGVSVQPLEKPNSFDDKTIAARRDLGQQFGTAQDWLTFSDALSRQGKHGAAANYLRNGVKQFPDNVDLWLGLGNALVLHGDNLITPAAEFAFKRAAKLAPKHPGPSFFLGLAYAQSGRYDEARELWQGLLERSPKDAPWRANLEQQLANLDQAQFGQSSPITPDEMLNATPK